MTANQNFRVGVSLDLSQARRAFRRLEQEFKELTFNVGDLREADRQFEKLSRSIRDIARDLQRIDKAFREVGDGAKTTDTRVDSLVRGIKRLATETRDTRGELREVADSLKVVTNELGDAGRALRLFDKRVTELNGNQVEANLNQVARSVENLREAMARSDDDARRLAEEIRDLADATRALDRANDAANRSQGNLNGKLRRRVNRGGQGNLGGFIGIGAGAGFLGVGGSGLGFAGAAGGIALITQLGDVLFEATRRGAEFVVQTSQITAEFDRLIRQADVLAGGGGIAGFTAEALAQGRRTIFTAREAANSLGELARAGLDVEESIAALPGVLDLAASDQVDLEKATLITARTLRAFRLDASAAGIVSDILAETAAASATNVEELGQGLKFVSPIAAQLGESLQATAAAMGILGDRGFVAGIAGRALRRTLQVLSAPSEKAGEALEKLGINAFNAQGDFLGFEEVARQVAKAEEEIGNKAEFVGLVFQAFGLRAAPQVIALADAVDEFGERVDENFRSFGRAAEIAQLQLAGLEGSLIRLRSAFESEQIESFIGTGLERELGGLVDTTRALLPEIFSNIVDPTFNEIAVGINRFEVETIPDLIDAFGPVGDIISETLGQVFNFIVENDEDIIDSAIGVANAVQAIIDTFIGLGEIALPIIGAINRALSALPDEFPAALTGAFGGAVIGGLAGLPFGPAGSGIGATVGILAGAAAGIGAGITGAILRDRVTQEETLAQFGVDLGIALSGGFTEGLTLDEAITRALQEVPQFQGTGVGTLADLETSVTSSREALEREEQVLSRLQERFEELQSGRGGVFASGTDFATEVDEVQQALLRTEDRVKSLANTLKFNEGALQRFLLDEEISRLIDAEIARARGFIGTLEEIGNPTDRTFRIEEDPLEVLKNLIAGGTAVEETVDGLAFDIPQSLNNLTDVTDIAFREFQAAAQDGLAAVAGELEEGQLRLIEALSAVKDGVANLAATLGGPLFRDIPDIQASLQNSFSLDFSAIFEPEEGTTVTAEKAKVELAKLLEEIPKEAAKEAQANINAIFAEEDLSLADKFLAAATVVDQAVQEQRATELADSLEAIFARSQELLQAADLAAAPSLAISRFLPEEDAAARDAAVGATSEQTARLQAQSAILLELVNSGDFALAQMAANSDAVLSAITDNSLALEDQRTRLEDLAGEVELELNIRLSDEKVQALIGELNSVLSSEELAAGAEAGAEGVGDAFIEKLGEVVPETETLFGISSPSTVFAEIGRMLAAGLLQGWDAVFPSLRTEILTDMAGLVTAIEASLNRLTIAPKVNVNAGTTTSGGRPIFHSGGLIPGHGDIPILAQGGEYMLRKSTVDYLTNVGVNLAALNRQPQQYYPDPVSRDMAASYSRTVDMSRHSDTRHVHNYAISAGPKINERRLARNIEKAFVKGVR